jgi:hypothetical protein
MLHKWIAYRTGSRGQHLQQYTGSCAVNLHPHLPPVFVKAETSSFKKLLLTLLVRLAILFTNFDIYLVVRPFSGLVKVSCFLWQDAVQIGNQRFHIQFSTPAIGLNLQVHRATISERIHKRLYKWTFLWHLPYWDAVLPNHRLCYCRVLHHNHQVWKRKNLKWTLVLVMQINKKTSLVDYWFADGMRY